MWTITSDEQWKNEQEFVKGTYKFEVLAATDSQTKNHNFMVELKLKLFISDSKTRLCWVNIVDHESFYWLRRHFWDSCGHPELLNSPSNNYIGRIGTGDFDRETYTDKNGQMKEKIVIVDFVPCAPLVIDNSAFPVSALSRGKAAAATTALADDTLDDDIPF